MTAKLDLHTPLDPGRQSLYADRVRVYPRSVHGVMRRIKWTILAVCLTVYYLLPWLRWNRGPGFPDQAVLLDIGHRKFYFFFLEFWPQDIYFLTGLLVMAAVSLFLATSLFGRVWCGYTCPQTVWTDLFMFVERKIQGDRNERMRRDAGPRDWDWRWRKLLTHAIWLGIAFWTGGAWIMYYVDAPTVTREFWTGNASLEVYAFTFLFTATTYLLAGWAREQVCTYMCPWPRFQSAMLDEQSFTTTYQAWRGEPRGHLKRSAEVAHGDCVDCGACVAVCPTGIDIRDGVQLECINCGLCIDACNEVMLKVERPTGLIQWDTLARQAAKAKGRHDPLRFIRPRTLIYGSVLGVAMVAMVVALASKANTLLSVQHDRAPLFVRVADGGLRNGYTLRIVNKTHKAANFALAVEGLPGARLSLPEHSSATAETLTLPVDADGVATFRVLVTSTPEEANNTPHDLVFRIKNETTGEQARFTGAFVGPSAP